MIIFHRFHRAYALLVIVAASFLLSACVATNPRGDGGDYFRPAKRDVAAYEEAGKWWGTRHLKLQIQANNRSDLPFVNSLIDPDNLDFFWVHSDLKDAFKKGYRIGYQDRTADLVLGPYLTDAAALIGDKTAQGFVSVTEAFESGWASTVKRAVNVFITLISEGSQADREKFIANFEKVYDEKYKRTQVALRAGGFVQQTSEGGTTMFIDARKTLAVLNIPSTGTLKAEIYHQTFNVMGDEWGRRFSHNLIKRDELVDLLRRSKTAFQEVPPYLDGNLGTVREAFVQAYGTDAPNVFQSLTSAAGYASSGAAPRSDPRPTQTPIQKKR
ncbi:MAG: hypothetical protein Q8O52_18195 [Sulfuritalea sp.]|nr:hypothetical protein [Sulfuritalea sp.]